MIVLTSLKRLTNLVPLLLSAIVFAPHISIQAESIDKFPYGNEEVEPGVVYKNVTLAQGRSVEINLPRDAAELLVAAPDVANAVVRSPRQIYVIALKNGQTSIIAIDKAGNKIAVIQVTNGRNIDELKRIYATALPKTSIDVRTVNNTIILSGSVGSPEEALRAVDIAQGFVKNDTSGPGGDGNGAVINAIIIKGRDQVMMHLTVAEVQRDVLKQFGMTAAQAQGSWGALAITNPFTLNPQQIQGNFLDLGNKSFGAQFEAYERNGVGRILAEPNVTAISGESAKFTAGGELPVPSSYTCDGVNGCQLGYQYKQYGITLNMTPVVMSEGRIQLHMATEVTEVDYEHQITAVANNGSSANIPAFRTRKNETTIELPSGGSIATAGLLSSSSRTAINGYPGLMHLPILGSLFRSRDYMREETELMIVATPYIVKPTTQQQLPPPTKNLMDASDPQSILLGKINRIYASPDNPHIIQSFKGKIGFIND